jgi:hypothetical protein
MKAFESSLFSPFLLMLLLLALFPAFAETSPADAEEQIDNGLKEFGYQAGLSRGCVAKEQVVDLEREVLDLHGDLGRLLGTDRAFLFAAAFGYGSSVLTPVEDCKAVLEGFEARVKSFRRETGVRP